MRNGKAEALPGNYGFNMTRVYKHNTLDKNGEHDNTYNENGRLIPDGVKNPAKAKYSEDLFQKEALTFIRKNKDRPFFRMKMIPCLRIKAHGPRGNSHALMKAVCEFPFLRIGRERSRRKRASISVRYMTFSLQQPTWQVPPLRKRMVSPSSRHCSQSQMNNENISISTGKMEAGRRMLKAFAWINGGHTASTLPSQ